jgi:hypothetical protein
MKTFIRNFVIVRNVIPAGQYAASVRLLKNYILLGTVLLTVTCAKAADLVWIGGTGNWNVAGNWSPAQMPTAADNAWITNSGTYTVTVPAGTTATNGSLTVGGVSGTQTLAIDRATLTVGGASVINANGHLDFLVAQSTVNGAGNLTVNGTLNWANGAMSGTGTTTIGSGGVLAIGSGGVTFGRTLNNAGTGSWSGGNLTMSAGNAFNNLAGGAFDITADGRLSGSATTPINNSGLFRQTAGTAGTIITVPFNNSGTLAVLALTLNLNLGGTHTGIMSNALGTTLNFGGGSHVLAGSSFVTGAGVLSLSGGATTLTASGTFDVTGSTLSIITGTATLSSSCNVTGTTLNIGGTGGTVLYNSAGSVAVVNLTAGTLGTLGGINPVTVTGPLTLGGGKITNALVTASGGLIINGSVTLSGAKLVNPGTAVWSAGNITGVNGAVISNLLGATFINTFDGNISTGAGATPIFVNAGSFQKTGATAPAGTTSIDFQFINTGTVEVQTNTLRYTINQQTAGLTLLDGGGLSAQNPQPLQFLGGSLVGAGLVTVANTVNVINSATISPGLPLGELDISGNYQQTASGVLNIELGGYTPGTNFDLVTVTAGGAGGVATLGGSLNITLTNGFFPTNGATFTFLTAVSRVGSFATFNYPSNDIGMQLILDGTSASVKVTNLKPVVSNSIVAPAAVTYEAAFNFQFPANTFADPDGDSLTYTVTGMPPGITFTGATRTFSGNPSQAGVFSVTVIANDGGVPNLVATNSFNMTVNPVDITGSFTAADKIYDGNTNATVQTRTPNGVLPADSANVTLTGGTASFVNATIGVGKTVTLTGATLTGTAATNYNLTSVATATASITSLGITGSFTAADKVYDGNTNANVLSRTPNGVLPADTANVTLTGGTASFANATVGAGKSVTLSGATLTGTAAANYNLTSVATATASIIALGITGSFTAADKIYDGNTNASVLTRTPNGVLPADTANVTLSGGIASFANPTVGAGKTVTLTGATLTGTAATNYNLTTVSNTTASITALGITGSFTAADKVYDGNTNAAVLTRTPNGVLPADTANVILTGGTASFANATVGTGKTVTVNGATLAGIAATNYNLTSISNTTASITALGITGSFTAADKVYDGNTNANVLTRTPNSVLPADAANVTLTGGTASFASATIGAGKTVTLTGATLSGTAATNYNLTSVSNTTASITAAALSVTADAKTKIFGAADPAFTASYVGFVNNETPAVLGGTLSLTRVSGETVGAYLITPSGLTSANYAIAFNTGTLTITAPAPLLLPLTHAGATNIVITWSAVSNGNYRVQFNPVLNTTNWTDLAGDVIATGSTASKNDTLTATIRFYRVRVLP